MVKETVVWFENQTTGQRWAVSHSDLIADLSRKAEYKQIADPTKPEIKQKKARKP